MLHVTGHTNEFKDCHGFWCCALLGIAGHLTSPEGLFLFSSFYKDGSEWQGACWPAWLSGPAVMRWLVKICPEARSHPDQAPGRPGPGEAEETSSRSVIPAQLTSNNLVMVFQKPQRVGCALKTLLAVKMLLYCLPSQTCVTCVTITSPRDHFRCHTTCRTHGSHAHMSHGDDSALDGMLCG